MAKDENNKINQERNNIIPISQGDRVRTLFEYAMPSIFGVAPSIRRPPISADKFELDPTIIQMVQATIQFHGLPNEDPATHIADFLEICDTFKCNGVSDDAIRLRLFPFSLKDKAKAWLQSQPSNSITTWEDLAKRFLARYFPPAKTAKLRSNILNFMQNEGESLYDAWERYKEMMRKCPHHGLPLWLIVQTFYNGISPSNRSMVDAISRGIFMKKTPEEAYNLLDEMATNAYYWQPERQLDKKAAEIHNVDTFTDVVAKLETLSKKLDNLTIASVQSQGVVCDLCGGNHITANCQEGNPFAQGYESANLMSDVYRLKGIDQGQKDQSRQVGSVSDLLSELVEQNQNNGAAIKKLEIQIGHIVNILSSILSGAFPNNKKTNLREEFKATNV